jgi:hypothetical protein
VAHCVRCAVSIFIVGYVIYCHWLMIRTNPHKLILLWFLKILSHSNVFPVVLHLTHMLARNFVRCDRLHRQGAEVRYFLEFCYRKLYCSPAMRCRNSGFYFFKQKYEKFLGEVGDSKVGAKSIKHFVFKRNHFCR